MPLIFGILVILNAVFLAWQFFEKQNTGQSVFAMESIPGKKLSLLSEKAASAEGSVEETPQTVAASAKPGGDALSCYRIGPVQDPDLLARLRGALERSGFEVNVESFSTGGSGYQVYLPPQPTVEKAQALARELNSKGLEATIIQDPRFANAVQAAVFADPEQAAALKVRLSDMGYQPEVRQNTASGQEQWLKVQSAGSSVKTQIDRLLGGTPHLRREPASCAI